MSKDFWIGIDQTLNTRVKLCDGYGKPDEMFSARTPAPKGFTKPTAAVGRA